MIKVAKYRRFIGVTQRDMAKYLGVSVQSYRNKEKGKTPFKDSEKVLIKEKLIANGFAEISIDEIFFDNEVAKSSEILEV
ncbi:helix-turn-helix transcriptional regulator [Mammaliicoccus lentus]|uniref:helix-turn-helix transcriptional regulator n=1 Tax=Mammaliicoccus lentus TaxID=42858 RepID=UPI003515D672